MKKELEEIVMDYYREVKSNPLLLSNCHLISLELKNRFDSKKVKSKIIYSNAWVKDEQQDIPYAFLLENGGHAWNIIKVDETEWLIDISLFHQNELIYEHNQPVIIPNVQGQRAVEVKMDHFTISYQLE